MVAAIKSERWPPSSWNTWPGCVGICSRATSVVTEVMAGHRPRIWVSDLYGAQQGHADLWQVCLAHQLRDCQYAIDAGDTVFAPRMKALLLRAVVLGPEGPRA